MIIGSKALGYWLGKEYGGDSDIITDIEFNKPRVELHHPSSLNNSDCLQFSTSDSIFVQGVSWPVCSLRGLALIKRSHMHRLWKWDRNMRMLLELNWPLHRDSLSEWERRFLTARTDLTVQEFKNPSLDKSNEEFFDDYVTKHFDHDSIHEFVAYGDEPLYKTLKRNPALAQCERDLWDQLPIRQKIECVLEECYVIGLERWMVPAVLEAQPVMPAKLAVFQALKKVCTTLSSGWFRDFAIDYFEVILKEMNTSAMRRFLKERLDVDVS